MKQMMIELRRDAAALAQLHEINAAWRTGSWSALLFHIYSGISDEAYLTALCQEIQQGFPEAVLAGTMSAGEICNGRVIEPGIVVSAMLFEAAEVRLLRFDDVKGREIEVGRQVRQRLDAIENLVGAELLFPGTSMNTQHMYEEISLCRREIALFGGYPGGHKLNSPEHYVFDVSGAMYNSMLVICYIGKTLEINVDKSVGWEALGMPFKVTRADGNHLIELDGRPAAEVYEKFLQIDRKQHNNAEEAFEFPLLANLDGDERLRSTVHIEEDGSIYLHGFVTKGMDIYLSYGNPSNIVRKVNQRLEALRSFHPQAILLYSCVVRKTFWEDFVDMEMTPFQELAPTSGFHTWGEIMRRMSTGELTELNITMLSIAMREGKPEGEPLPPAKVDDTILQGQASLLRRLTRLVYTSMEELQKAHNSLRDLNQQLTVLAERDSLTGLYNRRMIEDLINEALDAAADTGCPVSLVMVDVDHFKQVNDTWGHDAGDAVLREIAALLDSVKRAVPGAQTGRWGGEEFFILLPGQGPEAAMAIAEGLRRDVERFSFTGAGHLTVSQGVITPDRGENHLSIFTRVDNALYRAKESGRNRVVQCDPLK